MQITITAEGDRCSGKSTVLKVAKDALIAAGFEVSVIGEYGEEVRKEYMIVTTAKVTVTTEWLKR